MSFYIGNIVQAQFKRDNDEPLTIYYKIVYINFEAGQPIYGLRLLYNDPDRDIQSTLISNDTVEYKKVLDGTDKRNIYEG